MNIKIFDKITEEARNIREKVFIQEQGFENEYDEYDNTAKHIVIFENNTAIATCRVYYDNTVGCYHVGRIAVLKEHRGKGLGKLLVTEAEKVAKSLGGTEMFIGGQVRVTQFYQKLGYTPYGEEYYEENVPHIALKKLL